MPRAGAYALKVGFGAVIEVARCRNRNLPEVWKCAYLTQRLCGIVRRLSHFRDKGWLCQTSLKRDECEGLELALLGAGSFRPACALSAKTRIAGFRRRADVDSHQGSVDIPARNSRESASYPASCGRKCSHLAIACLRPLVALGRDFSARYRVDSDMFCIPSCSDRTREPHPVLAEPRAPEGGRRRAPGWCSQGGD